VNTDGRIDSQIYSRLSAGDLLVECADRRFSFLVVLSAEATANMSASEDTLSWLLDIIENDPDPYVRSA